MSQIDTLKDGATIGAITAVTAAAVAFAMQTPETAVYEGFIGSLIVPSLFGIAVFIVAWVATLTIAATHA